MFTLGLIIGLNIGRDMKSSINKINYEQKQLNSKFPKNQILKEDVSSLTQLTVTKEISTYWDSSTINVYENEKKWLNKLKDSGIIAKPVSFDDKRRLITTQYAGVPINKDNIPDDWEQQVDNIMNTLREYNVKHNDIKPSELIVNEKGKIVLVDFGWAHNYNEKIPKDWPSGLGAEFRCNSMPPYDNKYDDKCSIIKSILHLYDDAKN